MDKEHAILWEIDEGFNIETTDHPNSLRFNYYDEYFYLHKNEWKEMFEAISEYFGFEKEEK